MKACVTPCPSRAPRIAARRRRPINWFAGTSISTCSNSSADSRRHVTYANFQANGPADAMRFRGCCGPCRVVQCGEWPGRSGRVIAEYVVFLHVQRLSYPSFAEKAFVGLDGRKNGTHGRVDHHRHWARDWRRDSTRRMGDGALRSRRIVAFRPACASGGRRTDRSDDRSAGCLACHRVLQVHGPRGGTLRTIQVHGAGTASSRGLAGGSTLAAFGTTEIHGSLTGLPGGTMRRAVVRSD
jgi:hypothetical protein